MSLCLCTKALLKVHVCYPCTNAILNLWLEVKKSGREGAGLGLCATNICEPGKIITTYFPQNKGKDPPNIKNVYNQTQWVLIQYQGGFPIIHGCLFNE